ncbi:hypothetical protein U0C82_06850 [Fulvimarina sp. 2208YS6-2-32]|uniref:HicA toxin of toxin-antitoxin n=1 Tax=Fulvimarina uroteuthidis TaxID=3098149 RepID=A0ABU5I0I6_9HYPH|nr:hypothetical protein [Fulvimarina sp. 2208YS6-2-32]MDY8108862.1 hypothetical protein [Fulvimarina sp. 2208YS6-2-32]
MLQAIAVLEREGVRFKQTSGHQLKVGLLSFYPGKGTIYRDRDPHALDAKGLPAFLRLLRDDGLADANSKPVRPVDDPAGFAIDLGDPNDKFAVE